MPNPYIKKVSIISGVLGCVQSTAWCALSMIHFCYYSGKLLPLAYPSHATYKTVLSNVMYDLFVRKDTDMLEFNHKYTIYINGNVVLSLAIAYFIFSILWLLTSTLLIKIAMGRNLYKNGWILIVWTFLTLVISLLDVAASGILISDYVSATEIAFKCIHCIVYPVAMAVGLLIACRGIVLWLINIAFAVLLIYLLHISIKEFGDPDDIEKKWYKRLGFFQFTIPRPRLGTFMHRVRNPNEWWLFENTDSSGSSVSTGAVKRR